MQKYLLDTHIFLWWAEDPTLLSQAAQQEIEDLDNEIYLSVVVEWEIAIKEQLGKLKSPREDRPTLMRKRGLHPLPIVFSHIDALRTLPYHHKDPFDRLLIAQAKAEGLNLITRDKEIVNYGQDITTIPG